MSGAAPYPTCSRQPQHSRLPLAPHCLSLSLGAPPPTRPRLGTVQQARCRAPRAREPNLLPRSWHLNLNDCFLEGGSLGITRHSCRPAHSGNNGLVWCMRPDLSPGPIFSTALFESLRAVRLLRTQNQLKDGSMAEIEVGQTSPADTTIARVHGLGGALSLFGMMLAAALILVLLTNTMAETMVVGLLALLAVAGVFLLFGLLSGFLRLGDRVAEAEMMKSVTDQLDSALQIVNAQGSVLYRNRALERLTGRRSGRHASLEELFAGAPDTAQAYFRLSRAAERLEGRQGEMYV